MCKNCKDCPYRREYYSGDSWTTYMACILESDGRDYKDCDPESDYCIFKHFRFNKSDKNE